jgi:hypothetical protein
MQREESAPVCGLCAARQLSIDGVAVVFRHQWLPLSFR